MEDVLAKILSDTIDASTLGCQLIVEVLQFQACSIWANLNETKRWNILFEDVHDYDYEQHYDDFKEGDELIQFLGNWRFSKIPATEKQFPYREGKYRVNERIFERVKLETTDYNICRMTMICFLYKLLQPERWINCMCAKLIKQAWVKAGKIPLFLEDSRGEIVFYEAEKRPDVAKLEDILIAKRMSCVINLEMFNQWGIVYNLEVLDEMVLRAWENPETSWMYAKDNVDPLVNLCLRGHDSGPVTVWNETNRTLIACAPDIMPRDVAYDYEFAKVMPLVLKLQKESPKMYDEIMSLLEAPFTEENARRVMGISFFKTGQGYVRGDKGATVWDQFSKRTTTTLTTKHVEYQYGDVTLVKPCNDIDCAICRLSRMWYQMYSKGLERYPKNLNIDHLFNGIVGLLGSAGGGKNAIDTVINFRGAKIKFKSTSKIVAFFAKPAEFLSTNDLRNGVPSVFGYRFDRGRRPRIICVAPIGALVAGLAIYNIIYPMLLDQEWTVYNTTSNQQSISHHQALVATTKQSYALIIDADASSIDANSKYANVTQPQMQCCKAIADHLPAENWSAMYPKTPLLSRENGTTSVKLVHGAFSAGMLALGIRQNLQFKSPDGQLGTIDSVATGELLTSLTHTVFSSNRQLYFISHAPGYEYLHRACMGDDSDETLGRRDKLRFTPQDVEKVSRLSEESWKSTGIEGTIGLSTTKKTFLQKTFMCGVHIPSIGRISLACEEGVPDGILNFRTVATQRMTDIISRGGEPARVKLFFTLMAYLKSYVRIIYTRRHLQTIPHKQVNWDLSKDWHYTNEYIQAGTVIYNANKTYTIRYSETTKRRLGLKIRDEPIKGQLIYVHERSEAGSRVKGAYNLISRTSKLDTETALNLLIAKTIGSRRVVTGCVLVPEPRFVYVCEGTGKWLVNLGSNIRESVGSSEDAKYPVLMYTGLAQLYLGEGRRGKGWWPIWMSATPTGTSDIFAYLHGQNPFWRAYLGCMAHAMKYENLEKQVDLDEVFTPEAMRTAKNSLTSMLSPERLQAAMMAEEFIKTRFGIEIGGMALGRIGERKKEGLYGPIGNLKYFKEENGALVARRMANFWTFSIYDIITEELAWFDEYVFGILYGDPVDLVHLKANVPPWIITRGSLRTLNRLWGPSTYFNPEKVWNVARLGLPGDVTPEQVIEVLKRGPYRTEVSFTTNVLVAMGADAIKAQEFAESIQISMQSLGIWALKIVRASDATMATINTDWSAIELVTTLINDGEFAKEYNMMFRSFVFRLSVLAMGHHITFQYRDGIGDVIRDNRVPRFNR
jgi:hypothetical protein